MSGSVRRSLAGFVTAIVPAGPTFVYPSRVRGLEEANRGKYRVTVL